MYVCNLLVFIDVHPSTSQLGCDSVTVEQCILRIDTSPDICMHAAFIDDFSTYSILFKPPHDVTVF